MFFGKSRCDKCGIELFNNDYDDDVIHINFYVVKVKKYTSDRPYIAESIICPKCYHDRKINNRHHVHAPRKVKDNVEEEVVTE